MKKRKEYRSTGFSDNARQDPARLVKRDGKVNVRKSGLGFLAHFSVFHYLVTISWWRFNLLVVLSYGVVHLFFGSLYTLVGIEGLGLERRGGLEDLLQGIYFSAQTFSTVGFGRLNPQNHWINLISVAEMLVGMMYLALAAGLLFARFSRPVSKIVFSKNVLIAPYRQGTALMLRLANAKDNLLLDVHARLLLSVKTHEKDGPKRKFYELSLEMDRINMLALSWTIVHPIDNSSPLYSIAPEDLKKTDPELLVLLRGYNNTMSQDIHAQTSYKFEDFVWNARFKPVFYSNNGKTILEVHRINDHERADTI